MEMPPGAADPPAKEYESYDVKVTLPSKNQTEALLVSECQKLTMSVPSGPISKRFAFGQTVGYFKAYLEDGILNIGDRFTPKKPW